MCNSLVCANHRLVIQLTIIIFYHFTSFLYLDYSGGTSIFGVSFVYPDMPVTTRSMMKRGLQPPLGSAGLLTCPTCCTDGKTINNTDILFHSDSSSLIPELIDQCALSSSSSEADDSSSLLSAASFQISNFENFELLSNASNDFSNHNFDISHSISRMESGCNDTKMTSINTDTGQATQDDIMNMLSIISNQMMGTIQDLRNQLTQTESKFTSEIQRLSCENEQFRQNILADLQSSATTMNTTVAAAVPSTSNILRTPLSSGLPATPPPPSSQESLNQMMVLLNETFSKLSTVMSEQKSSEPKADWPKFSGDTKKFRHWYLAIVAQLSLAPWKEFYDSSTNSLLKTTTNTTLNEKLYAKLLLCLEGQVFQDMVSRRHLRANGLLLLQELYQTYRPSHVPEVTAAKTVEFWSTMKRMPNESVDHYYNRFQLLLDDLEEAGEPIPVRSAIRQFIFTLGSDFAPIQSNYRIGLLPEDWKTTDWPTLLVLCRDYANSVRPNGIKHDSSNDNSSIDRSAHHKKVKQWFLNPAKYRVELETEQAKHPGKCLYHLTKSHPTNECYIKKECEKILASKKHQGSDVTTSKVSNGQLRNIKEDLDEELVLDDDIVESLSESNDTNDDDLAYFARIKNHYLRLFKSYPTDNSSRHPMPFPIIVDSGANYHMFKEREFFTTLAPISGKVILGDGKTVLPIQGIGQVRCSVGDQVLTIDNVRFVPDLAESIYSLFLHIKQQNHGVTSSFADGLHLTFPNFSTKTIVGAADIYLDARPHPDNENYQSSLLCNSSALNLPLAYCQHTQETNQVSTTKSSDNLIKSLRQYYSEVKTKRQLNLDVPAGFRSSSALQKEFREFTPPCKTRSSVICNSTTTSDIASDKVSPAHTLTTLSSLESPLPTSDTNTSSSVHVPILRCVDKPSTSLPSRITYTEDFLRASVGFRRVDTIKSHLSTLYKDTVCLDNSPADAVLDVGDLSNIRKSPRNTTPVVRPETFGDVIHMDIVFGPDVAIGNVHYGLLFTDRFSRMTYVYPLQNLTSDIRKQLEAFFAHLGFSPKRLITDFDTKLIGGKAREYLNSLLIHVNAAPAFRQDKNGLAERHWQTLVAMSRSWLASAELPSSFWFYAVKRAAEICNYFPIKFEQTSWTTPFELAHQVKPDLRVLFKLFGVAAVRRERHGDNTLGKFECQSIPMIAIGRCPNSNGIQFYNPTNGTFVSSIDYKFQNNVTSGAFFGLKYQSGTFIYRLDETTSIFAPKFLLDSSVYVHTHSPPSIAKVIGIPSYNAPNVYTVSFCDGSIAEYLDEQLSAVDSSIPTLQKSLLPSWVKGGATATLFLNNMPRPRHGKLGLSSEDQWFFYPGKQTDKGILLEDFTANCQQLLESGQLFRGHTKFRNVYDARNQLSLQHCVLRHVSAHGLRSLVAPVSLKHHSRMSPTDKEIWDAAYSEEYDGLTSLPTWEVITEAQFHKLSKGKKALPTMAIATIKYDEHNKPKRAKYRLVVLGNQDYHTWSKEDTAAPVLSQLELRLLTSLAVYNKCVLKNCDVKQAFVQSTLPENEVYFLKPPPGCPRSASNHYWRLIRSLYGLKRAPRIWFDTLCGHLRSLGLKQLSPNSCVFIGHVLEGGPPIYIGIYVDDIIYFSTSNDVEKHFEEQLGSLVSVDFMGQVSQFLGIEFAWQHHPDGNISVSLTQQSFAETLIESLGFDTLNASSFASPYRSNLPVDSILDDDLPVEQRDALRLQYQSLVGSLNWLAHTTRPHLSTIVSLLAQHQSNPSTGHLEAAKHVVKYLAGTKTLGICFTSKRRPILESFLHFPLQHQVLSMSDANWGPQDASLTKSTFELPLFASRSMSAFYIDLLGPIHWLSKRQTVTAGSSAEAEIYATDECIKFLLELVQLLEFLGVKELFMPSTTTVYNDNMACVNWSKCTTTKGLRHIQMKENRVRESILSNFVIIKHIDGKVNLADIFTKEMKDINHFVELRDLIMCSQLVT